MDSSLALNTFQQWINGIQVEFALHTCLICFWNNALLLRLLSVELTLKFRVALDYTVSNQIINTLQSIILNFRRISLWLAWWLSACNHFHFDLSYRGHWLPIWHSNVVDSSSKDWFVRAHSFLFVVDRLTSKVIFSYVQEKLWEFTFVAFVYTEHSSKE